MLRQGKNKRLAMGKGAHTRICVCVPTHDATAATAARILCERWLAFFPEPTFLITDGGPHFAAQLFREIATIRGFTHHIVAPYSQWANGGVERLNQVFVARMRALLNVQKADWCDWPAWVPAIQEALNKQLKIRDRGNVTPMELLMGVKPKQALKQLAWTGIQADVRAQVDPAEITNELHDLHDNLPLLWARAVQAQVKRRDAARLRPGVTIPRIQVGDMVLVAQTTCVHKIRMYWTGPHVVVAAVSRYCYIVEPMVPPPQKRVRRTAYIVRIRRFSNGLLGTEADRRAIEEAAIRDFPDNFVQKFVGHRQNARTHVVELQVRWLGFDAAGDTWEPVTELMESVPEMVEAYLRDNPEPMLNRLLERYFPQ